MSEPAPVVAQPERPGITERRLHPAYLLIRAGQTLRTMLPLIIGVSLWRQHWWVPAGAGVIIVVVSIAEFWNRKYSVLAGELRVRSGVINREVHSIPISRITALDANRGIIQRLFGVWSLKVQTPGDGEHASVHLHSLSGAALEDLRDVLHRSGEPARPTSLSKSGPRAAALADDRAVGGAVVEGSDRAPADHLEPAVLPANPAVHREVVAVLGTRDLLTAALTGTSIPLLFVGGAAAWNRVHEVLPDSSLGWIRREVFSRGSATWVIVGTGLLLAALAGLTLTSLRLARFTLTREGERLRMTRGLIAQRSGTVLVDRIQAVRVVEGVWRRLLGYCALEVEVSGLGAHRESERMLFPLLRTDQVAGLMSRALPELPWPEQALTRVPARARYRYVVVPAVLVLPVAAVLALLPGWWAALALVPVPLAALIGLAQSASAGWLLDADTIALRWRRVLARHTVVARTQRVQITRLTRSPYQRRAQLGGITLALSSRRGARIRQLELADAEYVLHTVGRRAGALLG